MSKDKNLPFQGLEKVKKHTNSKLENNIGKTVSGKVDGGIVAGENSA